jgi:hypothetical protein
MSGWKRFFGLDLFDSAVHVGITIAGMILLAEQSRQPEPVVLFACTSAVVFSVRRYFALKRQGRPGEVSGETTTGVHRSLDNEARLQELESLYGRVAELEERVDFAERLLARKDEPMKLESPKG